MCAACTNALLCVCKGVLCGCGAALVLVKPGLDGDCVHMVTRFSQWRISDTVLTVHATQHYTGVVENSKWLMADVDWTKQSHAPQRRVCSAIRCGSC